MYEVYNERDYCDGFESGYGCGYEDARHRSTYRGLYAWSESLPVGSRSTATWSPVMTCLRSYRAGWRAGYAYGYDDCMRGCASDWSMRYAEHSFKLKVFGCDPTVREIEKCYDSTARLNAAVRSGSRSYSFLGG